MPNINAGISLLGLEQVLAKIKRWMRQAQKRTVEDTCRHIGHLVETIELPNAGTTSQTPDTSNVKDSSARRYTFLSRRRHGESLVF